MKYPWGRVDVEPGWECTEGNTGRRNRVSRVVVKVKPYDTWKTVEIQLFKRKK